MDGIPIRVVGGEAAVEFAGTFFGSYSDGRWIYKERGRLVKVVERAEEVDGGIR